MNRLSPRVSKQIEAKMVGPDGNEFRVLLKDIGLKGARIASKHNPFMRETFGKPAQPIKLSLDGSGFALNGEVAWRNGESIGVRFSEVGSRDLASIWEYLRTGLERVNHCPYCGSQRDASHPSRCGQCGWSLDFNSADYLRYWEKESAIRRMETQLRGLSLEALRRALSCLEREAASEYSEDASGTIEEFVGTCGKMRNVFSLIRKVATTDLPVLILGESGTGKDLTARAIHEKSLRRDRPYVAINCAAIPESLIEAELFGYERGAFTGAYQAKRGKFEIADQGTLFLDEIGEFPKPLQPKLLRFLEDQMVERVGSLKGKRVDVRIIAATNRDLEKAVADGDFRSDLYHRIKVFAITLPPLRERGEDKTILAKFLLKKIKEERAWTCKGFTPEALETVRRHAWPGNVREMINRIRRAVVVQDGYIRPEDLELKLDTGEKRQPYKEAKSRLKKELIRRALEENGYNMTHTARALGISRQHLYLLKKKFNLQTVRA